MCRLAKGHQWVPGVAGLTDREQEIIRLIWHGLRNEEIGRVLGLSRFTVVVHLSKAYARLDVTTWGCPRTRAAVALWRHERGG